MDTDVKTKWIAALRDGTYAQTQGYLHNEHGFCCLGVLCDVVADSRGAEWRFTTRYNGEKVFNYYKDGEYKGQFSLPEGFEGLTEEQITRLWKMNDEEGKTFSEIADWIESNIETGD